MEGERTEQELQRRQKLTTLRSQGIEPYQSRFDRTHSSAEALALFEQAEKSGGAEARSDRVALAGRLVAIGVMGKATFAHIQDFAGRIQLLAKVDKLGEAAYKRFTDLDLGDIIGVHGTLFRTKRGEITCEIDDFALLAKALRPLPEKYHGLTDKKFRYTQRDGGGDAHVPERARLRRGGDAGAASVGGRRRGPTLSHPSQRARHGPLPAHRPGAVPQAIDHRRLRPRVRDRPYLPQRGDGSMAQPGIHDARAVPGVHRC